MHLNRRGNKTMTPDDRATRVRRDIERLFREFLDRIEDIVAETLIEHEVDIRSEENSRPTLSIDLE
jgi:hypothetical protein